MSKSWSLTLFLAIIATVTPFANELLEPYGIIITQDEIDHLLTLFGISVAGGAGVSAVKKHAERKNAPANNNGEVGSSQPPKKIYTKEYIEKTSSDLLHQQHPRQQDYRVNSTYKPNNEYVYDTATQTSEAVSEISAKAATKAKIAAAADAAADAKALASITAEVKARKAKITAEVTATGTAKAKAVAVAGTAASAAEVTAAHVKSVASAAAELSATLAEGSPGGLAIAKVAKVAAAASAAAEVTAKKAKVAAILSAGIPLSSAYVSAFTTNEIPKLSPEGSEYQTNFIRDSQKGNVIRYGEKYLYVRMATAKSYITIQLKNSTGNLLQIDQSREHENTVRIELYDKDHKLFPQGKYSIHVQSDSGTSEAVGIQDDEFEIV